MPIYEGPRWPDNLIRWSFATSNLPGQPANFSSFIDPGIFQQDIIAALADWANVAPLRFVQVADWTAADIRFGWDHIDGAGTNGGASNLLAQIKLSGRKRSVSAGRGDPFRCR